MVPPGTMEGIPEKDVRTLTDQIGKGEKVR